jgi:hypothetical protein
VETNPRLRYTCWQLEVVLASRINFGYVQLVTCNKCKKDYGIQETIVCALASFDILLQHVVTKSVNVQMHFRMSQQQKFVV